MCVAVLLITENINNVGVGEAVTVKQQSGVHMNSEIKPQHVSDGGDEGSNLQKTSSQMYLTLI